MEEEEEEAFEFVDATSEISAMSKVAEALKGLKRDEAVRVITWVANLYEVGLAAGGGTKQRRTSGGQSSSAGSAHQDTPEEFSDVADLFVSARPKTDIEKALVVGYWHQKCLGQPEFDSQKINSELKNLGYGITNITRAFDNLQGRKPSYAIQIRKSGTSKQARKRFKLTHEGLRAVERMIGSFGGNEEEI